MCGRVRGAPAGRGAVGHGPDQGSVGPVTSAISIYRKLGVSSRGDAVTRAAELGCLDDEIRLQ